MFFIGDQSAPLYPLKKTVNQPIRISPSTLSPRGTGIIRTIPVIRKAPSSIAFSGIAGDLEFHIRKEVNPIAPMMDGMTTSHDSEHKNPTIAAESADKPTIPAIV